MPKPSDFLNGGDGQEQKPAETPAQAPAAPQAPAADPAQPQGDKPPAY